MTIAFATITIYLPYWLLLAVVGGFLWKMNNNWIAVGVWVISAGWAGFIRQQHLDMAVTQVKGWLV
jgi:hypothetical protein